VDFPKMNEHGNPSERPGFGLLLLNWNDYANVVACAESLLANDYRAARLYIIDNGSRPESVRFVQEHLPSAIVIENGRTSVSAQDST
jgi:GT2 family glycosyltransferase